jgi:hypothetical protein
VCVSPLPPSRVSEQTAELEAEIQDRTGRLDAAESRIRSLELELEQRGREVSELRSECSALEERNTALESNLATARSRNTKLQKFKRAVLATVDGASGSDGDEEEEIFVGPAASTHRRRRRTRDQEEGSSAESQARNGGFGRRSVLDPETAGMVDEIDRRLEDRGLDTLLGDEAPAGDFFAHARTRLDAETFSFVIQVLENVRSGEVAPEAAVRTLSHELDTSGLVPLVPGVVDGMLSLEG